mgnify:CR=1 FL=1
MADLGTGTMADIMDLGMGTMAATIGDTMVGIIGDILVGTITDIGDSWVKELKAIIIFI